MCDKRGERRRGMGAMGFASWVWMWEGMVLAMTLRSLRKDFSDMQRVLVLADFFRGSLDGLSSWIPSKNIILLSWVGGQWCDTMTEG